MTKNPLACLHIFRLKLVSNGSEPSDEPVVEQICEKKLSDIENPRLFYSWLGIASEFVRSEEIRDKQERYKEA